MRRTMLAMVVATALAAVAAAGTLVFKNGTKLEVKQARLQAGMVLVTLPNGAMQAYAASDVDLAASGLAPKPTPAPETAKRGPQSLAAFARSRAGKAKVTLTDADVEHVSPGEAAAGESGSEKVPPTLQVAVRGYTRRGDQLTVTGTVSNRAQFPVSAVRLEAVATGPDGAVIGRAEKELSGEVPAGGAANFSITLTLTGQKVSGVTVRVSGAVVPAQFPQPKPPAAEGGGQGS